MYSPHNIIKIGYKHVGESDNIHHDLNIETFIKDLEKQLKIEVTSIPQWEKIIQRLHVNDTDYKRTIQAANYRKLNIISKLFVQNTRLSPFELTAGMIRTAKRWENICNQKHKSEKTDIPFYLQLVPVATDKLAVEEEFVLEESSDLPGHPNTEILSQSQPSKTLSTKVIESMVDNYINEPPRLPFFVCTNPHKLVSPISTLFNLNCKEKPSQSVTSRSEIVSEWLTNLNTCVKCYPEQIIIENKSLQEQSMKVTIINCSDNYMNIRFKYFTNTMPFRRCKILPVTTVKLYPGLRVVFKFVFQLCHDDEEFQSGIYFKVEKKVLIKEYSEYLYIPVVSNIRRYAIVLLTETVPITPVYAWHVNLKCGLPSGLILIRVDDSRHYCMHIRKRLIDLFDEKDDRAMSFKALDTSSDSLQSKCDVSLGDSLIDEIECVTAERIVELVLDDIIRIALDAFIFEHTYLYLEPFSKYSIPVYFARVEHTGYHQCYYDFEFREPSTGYLIATRTSKVFAEVLPHPLRIEPNILDMTNSSVIHGYYVNSFKIFNTHRIYPAKVKVKLTTKMIKLLYIEPMETFIPTKSSVTFKVKFCSRDCHTLQHIKSPEELHELAYFTIKIVVSGNKTVYYNIPPIYYELIAPCAQEFKKVYSKKFYDENSNVLMD